MCKASKPKKTAPPVATPAPAPEPVVIEQKDENKVAKKNRKNSGVASLRIDRTAMGGDSGSGLNIPV